MCIRFFAFCGLFFWQPLYADITEKTEAYSVLATEVVTGLDHPWSMAFLPDGHLLITERSGQLLLIDKTGKRQIVTGLPEISVKGQGGLLDVVLHPDFESNHWVYFSFAAQDSTGIGTEVARGRLEDNSLKGVEQLFSLQPKSRTGRHFGSRLAFDHQNYLYITLGDRGKKSRAQDLNDHAGSVIRLHDDGRIPRDNPFLDKKKHQPEIFSYGHRNIQGAFVHPQTDELWLHEHGPQGGDELNISRRGRNYGWPIITYGVNYFTGTKIGEGTKKAGMEQPLYYWVPSIAPSGMAFYNANKFPQWKNNLLIGSLKFQTLVRLEIENAKVTHEERIFKKKLGRIRDVKVGPEGFVYLLTDADEGKLIKLEPVLK